MSLTNLTEESLRVNVPDVALIFEGGGMRASHSAGAVVTLLERGINFGHVYGISAGSSHTVNYVSRDARRAKASFVDLVRDPHFGGIGSFLAGRGYFNAPTSTKASSQTWPEPMRSWPSTGTRSRAIPPMCT